jgi:hypothetical protein
LIKDALSGMEIVGGTYPNKNNWETFGTIPLLKDDTVMGIEKDGIRLIDTTGIPGGFIIYSREAFERTRNSLETYNENDEKILQCFRCSVEDGLRVGEDIYFQRRYIENGGKVWLEPNISFYHFGVKGFPGNYHEYLLNNKTTLHIPEKKLDKKINVVMPFSRKHLKDTLIDLYKDVVLHPIAFKDQAVEWNCENVHSLIVLPPVNEEFPYCIKRGSVRGGIKHFSIAVNENKMADICYYKLNQFIATQKIEDDEYYWFMCDDDSFDEDVIPNLKECVKDVVFISMKRGHYIPVKSSAQHPATTLFARPENIRPCFVGLEQMMVRGSVLKTLKFDDSKHNADGIMAEYLSKNYDCQYSENIFVKFNYFEKGRWDT